MGGVKELLRDRSLQPLRSFEPVVLLTFAISVLEPQLRTVARVLLEDKEAVLPLVGKRFHTLLHSRAAD